MAYRLREETLSLLPKGSPTLRILHFSDLHLMPKQKAKMGIIRSWSDLRPDLVISTGDFLGHETGIDSAINVLDRLLEFPGLYVFGSNDHYGPRFKNPFTYFRTKDGERKLGLKLDTQRLDSELLKRGWINIQEKKFVLKVKGVCIEIRGTSDAHINLDKYSMVQGAKDESTDIAIGVTHAPYKRILENMARDKVNLILAGHTHGGQIRIPWPGGTRSIVTNCDLPNKQSRGISRLDETTYLNVSAGLGNSIYAPMRILCPREVSLLTLKPI